MNSVEDLNLDDLSAILIILSRILTALIIAIIIIYIVGAIIDKKSKYSKTKIKSKIMFRTNRGDIGGGQEAYLRYWVWQGNKRKIILRIFHEEFSGKPCYPKQRFSKKGKGRAKFLFLREMWVII